MLEKGPKISDTTKRHDTQLYLFDINGKLAWKCYRGDFSIVSGHLTAWLPKGVLKQELTCIQVATFFALNNFQNMWAMKVSFFWKTLQVLCIFQTSNKTSKKCF